MLSRRFVLVVRVKIVVPLVRGCSYKQLRVDDLIVQINRPTRPELVPKGYAPKDFNALAQSDLNVLKWIVQKDQLKQDIFLLGMPGVQRRRLVMQYLELVEKEYEYLPLTRDITESDIKQRREIKEGSAFYIDQAAIRAALNGRILILDGIEKAERNVLPILNNLLENREVHLDDGRFLVSPDRYDKLLQEHNEDELINNFRLVRVHEDFRVVALGLPVPKFRGYPLDPPLRSRFQAFYVEPKSFKDQYEALCSLAPNVPKTKISDVLSFVYSLLAEESNEIGIPLFPIDNLSLLGSLWNNVPSMPTGELLKFFYPYQLMLKKDGQVKVEKVLQSFNIGSQTRRGKGNEDRRSISAIDGSNNGSSATVVINWDGNETKFQVPRGGASLKDAISSDGHFVHTTSQSLLLADMLWSHSSHDFCLIGAKGCGKSVVTEKFASTLGYKLMPIMLYQDMTSRDLIQQRRMLPNGDTVWRHSPLIEAALNGGLAVLDGLHFVHHSMLNAVSSLIHDREIELFDGTRLISQERYNSIKAAHDLSDEKLKNRKIQPIHPSFRIIALAEPPNLSESATNWFTPELMNLFLFHHVQPLTAAEEIRVISKKINNAPENIERDLLNFVEILREDPELGSLARLLSTRQVLRIMKRLTAHPEENLHSAIHKACLSRFLPSLLRRNLENALSKCDISPSIVQPSSQIEEFECKISDSYLTIGKTKTKIFRPENKTLIPNILFYDNIEHLKVLENMLRDYQLGEHLLLVGNQGVGKNKIADRFLQLLNLPRQYVQLHRDTTVQTLTVQVTVRDGVIVYEDSPLVKAVKHGHILVIDEGDKAPTHVTVILKSLLESSYMHLSDGRKIVPHYVQEALDENSIRVHKNFRVIVLANRPGFPFLGNDFYSSLGDLFACHAVDNPSPEPELSMLKKYGPNVPDNILRMLSSAFHQLRTLNDQGSLSYPYSTRELVNIVKHLQLYPSDPLVRVVRNVFDFDALDTGASGIIADVLSKRGIPLGRGTSVFEIRLLPKFPLPDAELCGVWGRVPTRAAAWTLEPAYNALNITKLTAVPNLIFVEHIQSRTSLFTEQVSHWQLPISDMSMVSDVVTLSGGDIVVATVNPLCLYRLNTLLSNCYRLELDVELFKNRQSSKAAFKPRLKLARIDAPDFADQLLVHEEMSNRKLIVSNDLRHLNMLTFGDDTSSFGGILGSILPRPRSENNIQSFNRLLLEDSEPSNFVYFYSQNGNLLKICDFISKEVTKLNLPFNISAIFVVQNNFIIKDTGNNFHYLSKEDGKFLCHSLNVPSTNIVNQCLGISADSLTLSLGQTLSSFGTENKRPPSRILFGDYDHIYGLVSIGFPDTKHNEGKLLKYHRPESFPIAKTKTDADFVNVLSKFSTLPQIGQVIRACPISLVPVDKQVEDSNVGGYLEVVDFAEKNVAYLPVPESKYRPPYPSWYRMLSETNFVMHPYGQEGVVTVDSSGGIRTWETSPGSLKNSINAWRRMMGLTDKDSSGGKITIEKSDVDFSKLSEPKHGVTDPTGAPHFGGGTFAGGSGGFNTAGLGGAGGPYRLDLGYKEVHQVSDQVKAQIPEHIRQKAREMAKRAYAQRLKEIQMSEHEADMYEKFYARVDKHIQQLRTVIESLHAKSKERQWVRHQTSGDLDEGKIIDGITGEKSIYRRRADKEPEPGTPQQKPKRIRLCPDLSGSMYRFNGYDHRLERSLEACLMVMKAFEGFESRIRYEIVGHSGEQPDVEIVSLNKPTKDDADRLKALKSMLAHSQYCVSGDFTLEAVNLAAKICTKEANDYDETFIVVLSDANFRRYGISPEMLAKLLTTSLDTQDGAVHIFAIFIGSLGDEAEILKRRLPPNKSFVCRSAEEIPHIMQQILSSTVT